MSHLAVTDAKMMNFPNNERASSCSLPANEEREKIYIDNIVVSDVSVSERGSKILDFPFCHCVLGLIQSAGKRKCSTEKRFGRSGARTDSSPIVVDR
jgi:hypothetical protein